MIPCGGSKAGGVAEMAMLHYIGRCQKGQTFLTIANSWPLEEFRGEICKSRKIINHNKSYTTYVPIKKMSSFMIFFVVEKTQFNI